LNSGFNIQALRLQTLNKAIPMWFRSEYNSRIPGLQSGSDKVSNAL